MLKEDDFLLVSLIMQRRKQFLVHSFLFHELGESIVPDADFDRWGRELIELQTKHPELCAELPYHELTKDLDTSLSSEAMGISKSDYPIGIVTVSLHVLRSHKKSKQNFRAFAKKYGYAVEG